jgi:hypothetical protein
MVEAAAALQFERAAALRDRLAALGWLARHLERLRRAAARSLVYPVARAEEGDIWYLIQNGRAIAAVAAPDTPERSRAARAALEAVYAQGAVPGPLGADEVDGVLLVDAWFRRYPVEDERTLTPAEARQRCADSCS